MSTILPEEPIPQPLNETLEDLVSDFNQLEQEERKLSNQLALLPDRKPYLTIHEAKSSESEQDTSVDDCDSTSHDSRNSRIRSLISALDSEHETIKLQNRLLLCRLLLLNQSIQEVKKDLMSPADEDGPDDAYMNDNRALTIGASRTELQGEYARNYDCAEAFEDSHAYQTIEDNTYQSLLSNFNKTNEFD